jgi:hypothetical protein
MNCKGNASGVSQNAWRYWSKPGKACQHSQSWIQVCTRNLLSKHECWLLEDYVGNSNAFHSVLTTQPATKTLPHRSVVLLIEATACAELRPEGTGLGVPAGYGVLIPTTAINRPRHVQQICNEITHSRRSWTECPRHASVSSAMLNTIILTYIVLNNYKLYSTGIWHRDIYGGFRICWLSFTCLTHKVMKLLNIQGYYKRNRQFQHFIKPKLLKISTLAMHGFVEKLWKFYHCSPWWRKQRETTNYLDANLPLRWIGSATGDNMSLTCWRPRSPDLTPCDFFLWGYVKDKVFVPPVPVTLDDLKQRIITATAGVDDMLTRVWREFDHRVDICRVIKGAHIERL